MEKLSNHSKIYTMFVGKHTLLFLGLLQGCLCEFDCGNRNKWGYVCSRNCSELYFCRRTGTVWSHVLAETCSQSQRCSEAARNCIESDFCSVVEPSEFQCTSEGIFPSLSDCNKYHVCSDQLDKAEKICPSSKGYSVVTKNCSLDLTDPQCQYRPECNKKLDSGAWPGDENIFYLCVTSASGSQNIELYRCPVGQVFRDGTCVIAPVIDLDSEEEVTVVSSEEMHSETSQHLDITTHPGAPVNSKSPEKPGIPSNPAKLETPCRRKGLMEHHLDCTKYVYCDSDFQKTVYSCPKNAYFNGNLRRCLRGTCIN